MREIERILNEAAGRGWPSSAPVRLLEEEAKRLAGTWLLDVCRYGLARLLIDEIEPMIPDEAAKVAELEVALLEKQAELAALAGEMAVIKKMWAGMARLERRRVDTSAFDELAARHGEADKAGYELDEALRKHLGRLRGMRGGIEKLRAIELPGELPGLREWAANLTQ